MTDKKLDEIKNEFPSICYGCKKARKPASNENVELGFVGCALRATEKPMSFSDGRDPVYDWDEITEAHTIGTGWVDLRAPIGFMPSNTMITNDMIMTKMVTKCRQLESEQ